jgi:hypothetical protein
MNLGLETSYLGMVKAMKELAPKAATVAVCVKTSRKTSTMAIIEVARAHCNIYLDTLCLNFLSIILMLPPFEELGQIPEVSIKSLYLQGDCSSLKEKGIASPKGRGLYSITWASRYLPQSYFNRCV